MVEVAAVMEVTATTTDLVAEMVCVFFSSSAIW